MIEDLKNIPIFKVFPENILKELIPYIATENFKKNDVIFREGDVGNSMYIIGEGDVEIKKKDKVLSLFKNGDTFGEMALFESERRSADAVSKSDTSLYRINNQDFRKFIFDHLQAGAQFLYNSTQEMSRRLRRTSEYLITVFETGKIVGGDYTLDEMTGKILSRLMEDIKEATGGMILLLNPFTDMYDVACQKDMRILDLEKAVELISKNEGENIYHTSEQGIVFGVPVKDEKKVLGYIIMEKNDKKEPFSVEHEIIISAVGNQVGLGILKTYNKQEEEARRRLQRSRMKGY